jgi:hypothetical protein
VVISATKRIVAVSQTIGDADVEGPQGGTGHGGGPGGKVVDQGSCADLVEDGDVRQDVVDLGRRVDAGLEFHEETGRGAQPQEVEREREDCRDPLEDKGGALCPEAAARDHKEEQEQDHVDDLDL